MKKLVAVILAIAMLFSMASIFAYAADEDASISVVDTDHGNTEDDDVIEETYYSLLNFFTDLFSRINLLLEYIITVFFPGYLNPAA